MISNSDIDRLKRLIATMDMLKESLDGERELDYTSYSHGRF